MSGIETPHIVRIARARLFFVQSIVEALESGEVVAVLAHAWLSSIEEVALLEKRELKAYKIRNPRYKNVTKQLLASAPSELKRRAPKRSIVRFVGPTLRSFL